jgi:hypothetical protein
MQANDVSNLNDTIIPKSNQLTSDDLLGKSITITVTGVHRGDGEQPIAINYQNDAGRPYKPCKSMRKVLIFAWGDDGREWVGRSMTLYTDPEVKFGGVKVGGIRISQLSHIDRDIEVSLATTKGKKGVFNIKKMAAPKPAPVKSEPTALTDAQLAAIKKAEAALEIAAKAGMESLQTAWVAMKPALRKAISPTGCPEKYKQIATDADFAAATFHDIDDADAVDTLNTLAAEVESQPEPSTAEHIDTKTGEITTIAPDESGDDDLF